MAGKTACGLPRAALGVLGVRTLAVLLAGLSTVFGNAPLEVTYVGRAPRSP